MPFSYIKEVNLLKKLEVKVSFQSKIAKTSGEIAEFTRFRYFSIFLKTGKIAEFFRYLCSAIWTRHCIRIWLRRRMTAQNKLKELL